MEESLSGRVALITGASSGIGWVAACELLSRGAHVVVACRSREKAEQVLPGIRADLRGPLSFLPLELGDFDSVRGCAARFLESGLPLHLLINNAGLAGRGKTASGFELCFGVNHLGHFLLTSLLRERLINSAPARIVNVASRAHRRAPGIAFDTLTTSTRSLTGIREYQVSKLANVLFSAELGRLLSGSGVTTYALHPGVVDTAFWRAVPPPFRPLLKLRRMISAEAGARTLLHCATTSGLSRESGLYYADCQVVAPSGPALDRELGSQLWEHSEAWTRSPKRVKPGTAVWDSRAP